MAAPEDDEISIGRVKDLRRVVYEELVYQLIEGMEDELFAIIFRNKFVLGKALYLKRAILEAEQDFSMLDPPPGFVHETPLAEKLETCAEGMAGACFLTVFGSTFAPLFSISPPPLSGTDAAAAYAAFVNLSLADPTEKRDFRDRTRALRWLPSPDAADTLVFPNVTSEIAHVANIMVMHDEAVQQEILAVLRAHIMNPSGSSAITWTAIERFLAPEIGANFIEVAEENSVTEYEQFITDFYNAGVDTMIRTVEDKREANSGNAYGRVQLALTIQIMGGIFWLYADEIQTYLNDAKRLAMRPPSAAKHNA